jgi:hypothetical protein
MPVPERFIAPKDRKKLDRFIEFALVAAQEALDQAGWHPTEVKSFWPRELQGKIELAQLNLQPGREHPLFICARQRDQSRVWTSALFLTL